VEENYFKMDKDKLLEVIKNVKDKSNKDLFESRDLLQDEFEKTKQLIIDLTRHMEAVEINYEIINTEIGKRVT
jgi:hypothetical protein